VRGGRRQTTGCTAAVRASPSWVLGVGGGGRDRAVNGGARCAGGTGGNSSGFKVCGRGQASGDGGYRGRPKAGRVARAIPGHLQPGTSASRRSVRRSGGGRGHLLATPLRCVAGSGAGKGRAQRKAAPAAVESNQGATKPPPPAAARRLRRQTLQRPARVGRGGQYRAAMRSVGEAAARAGSRAGRARRL